MQNAERGGRIEIQKKCIPESCHGYTAWVMCSGANLFVHIHRVLAGFPIRDEDDGAAADSGSACGWQERLASGGENF